VVDVDGTTHEVSANYPHGDGLVGLLVSDRPDAEPHGLAALQAVRSAYDGKPQQAASLADDLPEDWRLFTCFPIVVVDGRASVSAEVQDALRRYAFAGGSVVVAAAEQLPSGPLRDLATASPGGAGSHGLGQIAATPAFGGDTTAMRVRLAELPPLGRGLWPAAKNLFAQQDIADLGQAPVAMFVLVILLFAILVGPVNFLVLRRRRRPLLALVTVPLLGFGTTFVILGYGVFHDGFGVRGVVTSWTMLDQARHEATTIAARSLFAGLAPSELTMPADALVLSLRAGATRRDWPDRWHWDADRERLDGGVLPSRTVTPLLSVQQGTARQRLTVRVLGDDALELLVDGGVVPVGQMVLRDLDGRYWAGTDGRLERVGESQGRELFAEFETNAWLLRVAADGEGDDLRVPSLTPPSIGQPGSYIAGVSSAPWLGEHGLDVDYDEVRHIVFGRMHAEDFVR
jgi:hypothetical protein